MDWSYNREAWKIGTEQENIFQQELQDALNVELLRSKTNEDEPDLIEPKTGAGMEVKKRSGEYPTTSYHVHHQIMPKFYAGEWKQVTYKKGNKRIFLPCKGSDGNYVVKPKWRNRPKYVIMNKIAPPTRAAAQLLMELKIQLVTIWEMKQILSRLLNPRITKCSSITELGRKLHYSFSSMHHRIPIRGHRCHLCFHMLYPYVYSIVDRLCVFSVRLRSKFCSAPPDLGGITVIDG